MTQSRRIILKSAREIERMRAAGRIVHRVLAKMWELAEPGVTTAEMNVVAEAIIEESGGKALFKGVTNPQAKFAFPAALCTSVNAELVHGVPSDRKLEDGDILSVDCGVQLEGYCGDSATTIPIGKVSSESQKLLDVTKQTLELAIAQMKPGRRWSEVAQQMQTLVERNELSVVKDFVGHGIGRSMHEEPKVPNYWGSDRRMMDFELEVGMVLAVEPMVNVGEQAVEYGDADRWVIVTRDGKNAAHFEHTLAMTEAGVEVLTDGR